MSYGSPPATEMSVHGDSFESAATLALGRLLVAASRLDLALQLYVAALPDSADATTPPARLDRLLAHAETLSDAALRAEFARWIGNARQAERLGQALRHGRWLPDPRRNVVLLLARPDAPRVDRASFTIGELDAEVARHRALLGDLQRLCMAERGLTPAHAATFLSTQPIDVAEEK